MFKYYIYFAFHCFTQYYKILKKYYESLCLLINNQIFLCALYKKGGVEEMSLMFFLSIVSINQFQDYSGLGIPQSDLWFF